MSSYLMKIIGGVLAIVLLMFVPLVTKIAVDEIGIMRKSWNAVENYVDIVNDKGLLTKSDYEDFILKLSSNGIIYKVDIEISRRIAVPVSAGTANIIYQPVGFYSSSPSEDYQILSNTKALYKGDIVTVTCVPLNKTVGQIILTNLTKVNGQSVSLSLSGMVRNNGEG